MDADRKQDLERLNAFVDGELDVDARAEVMARAARDPAYARELAALSRLKATVAESVAAPEIALPRPVRRRRVIRCSAAIAASLLLLAVAGAVWFALDRRPGSADDLAFAWTIEIHHSWAAAAPGKLTPVSALPLSAVLDPYVPDLSASGLDLVHVAERRAPDGSAAMTAGYLGSRGCRLTMLVTRWNRTDAGEPVEIRTGRILASVWRAGLLRYELLAEGMDPDRFELISDSVRRASLERLPLDQDTRTAMARSRAASPPCAA